MGLMVPKRNRLLRPEYILPRLRNVETTTAQLISPLESMRNLTGTSPATEVERDFPAAWPSPSPCGGSFLDRKLAVGPRETKGKRPLLTLTLGGSFWIYKGNILRGCQTACETPFKQPMSSHFFGAGRHLLGAPFWTSGRRTARPPACSSSIRRSAASKAEAPSDSVSTWVAIGVVAWDPLAANSRWNPTPQGQALDGL